jgi:hypothetical protein
VLLTTYLNAGCAVDPVVESGVVSETRVPKIVLMMVVFHSSVDAWLYELTDDSAFSQA